MNCPLCGKEIELTGFDVIVTDVDEYGEPDSFAIVGVYVCHNCKVFIMDKIEDVIDYSEGAYKIEEEYNGEWAKIPEGYTGLP